MGPAVAGGCKVEHLEVVGVETRISAPDGEAQDVAGPVLPVLQEPDPEVLARRVEGDLVAAEPAVGRREDPLVLRVDEREVTPAVAREAGAVVPSDHKQV